MNPSLLKLVFNLGSITKALRDIEGDIEKLAHGSATWKDAEQVFLDLLDLVKSGVITIPGMSAEQVAQVAEDVKKQFTV